MKLENPNNKVESDENDKGNLAIWLYVMTYNNLGLTLAINLFGPFKQCIVEGLVY